MYLGLDVETNELVDIEDADSKKEYICPHCKSKLIQKCGDINVWHFAHESLRDCDDWSNEMSEWHKNWQAQFPKRFREVDITYRGKTHRADVCVHGYIIEFQHSSISAKEFNKRNKFYTNAGYKVIWIFDLTNQYYNDQIIYNKQVSIGKCAYKTLYNWNHRIHTFDDFYPQYEKNIILFFQLCDECFDEDYYGNNTWMLNRVVWAIEDEENDCANFKRFYVRHDFFDFDALNNLPLEYFDDDDDDEDDEDTPNDYGGINGYICTDYEFVQAIKHKEI